ncbi:F420-dependent biliverdin reductase, partial [Mycobacteroides abscessus subsp. abscessus]|nr:F420-dependent biliverdin reductase [Mycobacteroides abscessus subsp. abscessus]
MPNTPTTRLTDDALAFLSERHLAMLTTLRQDNSPHVV